MGNGQLLVRREISRMVDLVQSIHSTVVHQYIGIPNILSILTQDDG